MAKSLIRDDTAYPGAEGSLQAWSRTLSGFAREFREGTAALIRGTSRTFGKKSANDYSTMSYDELRRIADNDAIAGHMSEEEYERLSVELWRKFSAEKLTAQVS